MAVVINPHRKGNWQNAPLCNALTTPYIDGCTHIYISIYLLPTLRLLGKHYLLSGLYSIRSWNMICAKLLQLCLHLAYTEAIRVGYFEERFCVCNFGHTLDG